MLLYLISHCAQRVNPGQTDLHRDVKSGMKLFACKSKHVRCINEHLQETTQVNNNLAAFG